MEGLKGWPLVLDFLKAGKGLGEGFGQFGGFNENPGDGLPEIAANGRGVGLRFTGVAGGKGDLPDRAEGTLGGRIKPADRFKLVPEKVEPAGGIAVEGIDVDEAAAEGELPGTFTDRLGIVIEVPGQLLAEAVEGDGFPGPETDLAAGERFARGSGGKAALGGGEDHEVFP